MSKRLWAIHPDMLPSADELRRKHREQNSHLEATDKNPELNIIRKWSQLSDISGLSHQGVGIVSIRGTLETDGVWWLSYKTIAAAFDVLEKDDEVAVILMDTNSPGGYFDGAIELTSLIRKCSKPVYAYIEGMGCSAAYLLASAARKIFTSPSSEIGSVGVRADLVDYSDYDRNRGVKRFAFFGPNSSKKEQSPKTEEGKKSWEKYAADAEALFLQAIATNRSISVETVKKDYGQGEVFFGAEAKARGLVDEIVEDIDACVELIKPSQEDEGESMAETQYKTTAELKAAFPDLTAQLITEGHDAGVAEGVKAEQERVAGIMALAKNPGRMEIVKKAVAEGKTKTDAMEMILTAEDSTEPPKAKSEERSLEALAKESAEEDVTPATVPGDGTPGLSASQKLRAEIDASVAERYGKGAK